jgi:hypothetical protein
MNDFVELEMTNRCIQTVVSSNSTVKFYYIFPAGHDALTPISFHGMVEKHHGLIRTSQVRGRRRRLILQRALASSLVVP